MIVNVEEGPGTAMLTMLSARSSVVALRGVVAIVFGVASLVWPAITVSTLVVLFGVYALTDGVLAVATALGGSQHRDRWVLGFEGIVDVVVGGVVLAWPSITTDALVFVIAVWAVATGLSEVLAAVRLRRDLDHEWLLGIAGVSSVAVGALLAARTSEPLVAIAWLMGAFMVGFGGLLLALSFRLRGAPAAPVASSGGSEIA